MVTIKDVAREAGVSVATVSRVHNNSRLVTDATRRRVRAVAQRLRYSPNAAARSLSTSRTSSIGVLLPDLYGEFYSELIRGIDQTAQRHGYHLLVASSHNEKGAIAAALQSMRGRVDGLIVMSPAPGAHLAVRDLGPAFPVVLLNSGAAGTAFDSLAIANAQGTRAIVHHLVALGHRRIATITGPARNSDAAERLRGYRAALREAGVAVPGDVAVAGFDDIPTARYAHPPLSTVRVDISALGERGTRRLLDAVANGGRDQKRRETLPVTLVIRESCGGRGQPATASPP